MEPPEPIKPLKRRRRWRQFSLSTLLIAVTILGVTLGLARNAAERQRRAVAAIRELGGHVRYDFEPEDGTPAELPGPDWLCRMLGVDYFADVVHVRATAYGRFLKTGASGLQGLSLQNAHVTDARLAHLAGLTSLQSLNLAATEITDAGLAHLAALTSLQSLNVASTEITDAGLPHLARLASLQSLDLTGTRVTGVGLEHLAGLTSLQSLRLQGTGVIEVEHLAGLKSLQSLDLQGSEITDAGLTHLARLTSLQSLVLNATRITDAGLEHVAGVISLESLYLFGTRVTEKGRDKLQQALPNCSINHYSARHGRTRSEGQTAPRIVLQPLALNPTMAGMEASGPIKPRKRRWSWPKYCLSTLLVAVMIGSVSLGVANRPEHQLAVVCFALGMGTGFILGFGTGVVFQIGLPEQKCPDCGEPLPRIRMPANRRQFLWGGGSCTKCGCEVDRHARKIAPF